MEQQWRGGGGGGRGSAEEVKGRMRLKMRGLVKGMMEEKEFTDGQRQLQQGATAHKQEHSGVLPTLIKVCRKGFSSRELTEITLSVDG